MRSKKMVALLSAVAMTICSLAGCGQKPVEQNESKEIEVEKKEESVSTPVESEDVEASPYPEYLNLDGYRPIVKEGEDVTLDVVVIRATVAQGKAEDCFTAKFIEDKLNINLNIEEWSTEERSERKNLMLGTGELPDMLFYVSMSKNEIVTHGVEGGLLLPISDYFSPELTPTLLELLEKYPEIQESYTAPDGKMYEFPTIQSGMPGLAGNVNDERIFYDMEAMASIGYDEVPKTLDEFVELLRAYKAEYPDRIPLIGINGLIQGYLRTAFGWVGGSIGGPTWDNAEGKIVIPAFTEKYKAYLELMNTLYSEELIHPDVLTMDMATSRALEGERKSVVLAEYAPYVVTADWKQYWACTPLSSEWNDTPVASYTSQLGSNAVYISADTEYPEVCMRLLDYLYTGEGSVYSFDGAPAGSGDTLGLFEGFTVKDLPQPEYTEADLSKYDTELTFKRSVIQIAQISYFNGVAARDYYLELGNLPEDAGKIPDYENKSDEHLRWTLYSVNKDYWVRKLPSPFLDAEMNKKIGDLSSAIGGHINQETAKFITGQRSLDEYEAFQEELKKLGAEEYYDLYLEVYKDYSRE